MTEQKRQKCEIYSRVVGFLTPVSQWNRGKKKSLKTEKHMIGFCWRVMKYKNRK